MRVVITGGGGFLGLKLAKALLARGALATGEGGEAPLSKLVLLDAAFPDDMPADARLEVVKGDVSDPWMTAYVVLGLCKVRDIGS